MSVVIPTDLFSERPRCADYLRGTITVSHRFFGPVGAQGYAAEVEISYEGQYPLDFVSQVSWPAGEDYPAAIRRGALDALRERGELSIGGKFTLTRVVIDPVFACERAFFLAAREATASILRLLQSHAEA